MVRGGLVDGVAGGCSERIWAVDLVRRWGAMIDGIGKWEEIMVVLLTIGDERECCFGKGKLDVDVWRYVGLNACNGSI